MEIMQINRIFDHLSSSWNYYFIDLADPWTKDWFMVGSFETLLPFLAGYVYFCTKLGPRIMKNREPFKLTRLIQLYNIVQVLLNMYLFYQGFIVSWNSSFACVPVDYSDSDNAMRTRRAGWYYFMVKILDHFDTVFFVLRKKYNQVTFLHVYHHTLMTFGSCLMLRFAPGGHAILLATANALVHVVLYLYYFLASFGPKIQKYLWWKNYVTQLQLVQFIIIFTHNVQAIPRDCSYPKILNIFLALNALYFVYLFGSFYVRAYIQKKPQRSIIKDRTKQAVKGNSNSTAAKGNDTNGVHDSVCGSVKNEKPKSI